MNEEYIIDGTSIICNAEKEQTLAPLLQLLILLKNQGNDFYCYFDADTRYKFEKEVDKQVYQNLIKFGMEQHFVQVSHLDADVPLLEQADAMQAKIISCDRFESYYETYPWLVEQRDKRIIPIEVIAEKLILEKLNINTEVERDVVQLAVELVHIIEKEANNLHGTIDKYKKERQFGFVKRANVGKNLFFAKTSVSDKNLDYTVTGTEVTFKIDMSKSGSIYYFCATDVRLKEITTPDQKIDLLANENKNLKATKDKIQEQTAEAKANFERQLQNLEAKYQQLEQSNKTLQKEVATYKGSDNQTIKKLEQQKKELLQQRDNAIAQKEALDQTIIQKNKEIESLKAKISELQEMQENIILTNKKHKEETNQLAVVVDVQEEKIKDLDEDLKNTLKMFEFQDLEDADSVAYNQLKQDYMVAVNSIKRKNSKIIFLTNNINDLRRQLTLNTEQVTGSAASIDDLMERIKELEKANATLSEEVKNISTTPATRRRSRTKKETEAEEYHSDSEVISAPSSSRPSKLQNKPKPRDVKEIPRSELLDWWHNLSENWQKAFNQGVLSRGEILSIPSEEQLRSIFERKKIDIVGSGILLYGLNQLSFKLEDLSGLKDLKHITELNLSGHNFTDMEGINDLPNIELLNCTSNRISTLRHIRKLEKLKTLIIRDNDLVNLDGVEDLDELEYLNALYNQKLRSIGGVEDLENLQVLCVPNYKTKIIRELNKLKKVNPEVEVRNV